MRESCIIITNNPLSKEKFNSFYKVEYIDEDVVTLLNKVRDYIHLGHKLLTHPLMSSIKPNETPYRTVVISKENKDMDVDSLMIIENSIATTLKFIKDFNIPSWPQNILDDFQLIDYDLIQNAIN
ncbi:GrdX family protein [Clostridium hydrogeniformans]|uniref:GrdX family protein n=1 Tax=Clostridium hydrogeniformans TaxID=349933 RepID=UPI00048A1E7F|nr:GrdX family protein [Clostridium hydrogeniformans]